MAVDKAASKTHGQLLKLADKFLSPAFKSFFTRKIDRDYGKIAQDPKNTTIAQEYVKKGNELSESLGRVVDIYNRYHDGSAVL